MQAVKQRNFSPHSQQISLSWPFTSVYTVSVSDQARISEVHQDFSKESSHSANSRQVLAFSYGPRITWGLTSYFQSELPNYNSNNLWLPTELKSLTPFEIRSCTSRGSAKAGERGRRRHACAMPNANNIQKAILSVLTVLQAVKQWPRCKDSLQTLGKKIALEAHSTS